MIKISPINPTPLLCTAGLLVCLTAPVPGWCTTEVIAGSTHDDYTKSIGIATRHYELPAQDVGSTLFHPTNGRASILGNVTDTGLESMSIRVVYTDTSGWAFLHAAHDADGSELLVDVINREILTGGRVTEEISIPLSRPYLQSHLDRGTDIRIDGKHGHIFVKLPAAYLSAFFGELERAEAAARGKLASRPPAAPGKLGVGFLPVDQSNFKTVGLPTAQGVIVGRIDPGSVAEKAGLKVGDVLIAANGAAIPATLTGLPDLVASIPPGIPVKFSIWREKAITEVSVTF